jgi:hypothetical protein
MECLIPLSALAKLQKYGVKAHKPYNDAKKAIPEKYGLSIVDDPELGKVIRLESEDDVLKFFSCAESVLASVAREHLDLAR